MSEDVHPAASTRGRIVMIVDNGVVGDSRVQKAARSAAEAGWEVILLGMNVGTATETAWHIGQARVELISTPRILSHHRTQYQRTLRRPFAYPPGRQARYRKQVMEAWRVRLWERWMVLSLDRDRPGGRVREVVGKSLLVAPRAAAKASSQWVRFRTRELRRAKGDRQNSDAALTKLPIWFWTKVRGPKAWRHLDRGLWDYELAFRSKLDELEPDIIHAHDFRMLGVAVRAAMRARLRGQRTKVLWDAHEFVAGVDGRADNPRWLPAQVAYVHEYARRADAVVTVSDTLADLLRETYKLPERPSVVLNAPMGSPEDADDSPVPDLRMLCGIGPDTPLLVYSGAVNPVRGVEVMIDALPSLPDVHVALITLHSSASTPASEALRARAEELGVADRVHILGYVPHWQVVPFLAAADAGVVPILHRPNHELALITKFLEYSRARLPIVVSDVRTMAAMARESGQGEVFRAGDVADYVNAVRAVLADPERYRKAYDRPGLLEGWTWEAQAQVLDGLYADLIKA